MTKQAYQIRQADSFANVIVTVEANTFRAAVEQAVKDGVDLSRADFRDTDLSGADLTGMKAQFAAFRGADLTGTKFVNADVSYSYFTFARADRADFRNATAIGFQNFRPMTTKGMKRKGMIVK